MSTFFYFFDFRMIFVSFVWFCFTNSHRNFLTPNHREELNWLSLLISFGFMQHKRNTTTLTFVTKRNLNTVKIMPTNETKPTKKKHSHNLFTRINEIMWQSKIHDTNERKKKTNEHVKQLQDLLPFILHLLSHRLAFSISLSF